MWVYQVGLRLLRRLDPETAHRLTLTALRLGLASHARGADDPVLACRVWGRDFANPIGMAAGFDKNALAVDATLGLGLGFVEVGGVAPEPQAGNPRPRLFRLDADHAVINRMGFNNDGMHAIAERLRVRAARPGTVGVNLASNTDTADPRSDFETLVARFASVAAFLTIDISCPNTANGRLFLRPERLANLLARVQAARASYRVPLLAKLSPDVDDTRLAELVAVCTDAGIDGMIATNTTTDRPPSLASDRRAEPGGLSGRPLFARSTKVLRQVYAQTRGRVPLIGVGGVSSADDAYAKIRAGASLIQLYTALVFAGPQLVTDIKTGLAARLRADGFDHVCDAVGADHR